MQRGRRQYRRNQSIQNLIKTVTATSVKLLVQPNQHWKRNWEESNSISITPLRKSFHIRENNIRYG